MKLALVRDSETKFGTFGKLYVNSLFLCNTLEDIDRRLETNPSAKIRCETAIPTGTYNLIVTLSNRFKTFLPLVQNVPGFEGIRIHTGNTNHDTEGCILVGKDIDLKNGALLRSRVAMKELMAILNRQREPITLTVRRV